MIRLRDFRRLGPLVDQRVQQPLLAAGDRVDGRDRNAGAFRDLVDLGPDVSALREQLTGGSDDRLPSRLGVLGMARLRRGDWASSRGSQ